MKPDVSSAANEPTVKDLLAAYQQALDLAERLPRIVLLRRSDDLPRWVRTPRSRLFVRYFLVSHMRRALLAFKRGCQREAALGRSSETTSDIAALDQFEQSLPT